MLLRRNITALIASLVVFSYALPRLPFASSLMAGGALNLGLGQSMSRYAAYGLSLAVYLVFVAQSLTSSDFRSNFERRETINEIKRSAEECRQSARVLKRKLELKAQQRLNDVLKESDEIVQSFLNGDKNPLKVRVVQQSVKLTSSYIKLAEMFRARSFSSDSDRVSQLAKRINANTSNLNNVRDPGIADELRRVIEADEKMIESLRNERFELEKIDARLQYMESTIGMLKYNIISNLESEDILSHLESDVQEATALNSALTDRYDEKREERRLRI